MAETTRLGEALLINTYYGMTICRPSLMQSSNWTVYHVLRSNCMHQQRLVSFVNLCLLKLNAFWVRLQGRLNSANLGDSGFLVLGKTPVNQEMHLKYRSPQQEHQFGCPYQLGHEEKADKPRHAMLATVPVSPCWPMF